MAGIIVNEAGACVDIIEEKDLIISERDNNTCYSGAMAIGHQACPLLEEISCDNVQSEYYLTSLIALANQHRIQTSLVICPEYEALGANDLAQLAAVEKVFQRNKRMQMLNNGVQMIAPETVWFSADTSVAAGVTIEPNVVFKAGVRVDAGAKIRAFSWLEGCNISSEAEIGPFARVRIGSKIGERSKLGNFVETKAANVGEGTKINHLTYIGDADIGKNSNIGAGTITCNYDGTNKHRTTLGNNVFIGSNSSLVAPITVGDGAYVGSGSVITSSVTEQSLAVGRARQREITGWAAKRTTKK